MPLHWDPNKKPPYACNHFAVLQVGPNTRRPEITDQEAKKRVELAAGVKVFCACGHEVDEHQLGRAKTQLLEPRSYAEELLLVHPQPPKDDRKRIRTLVENLCRQAVLPLGRPTLLLRDPAGLFWFTPAPEDDAIAAPSWDELGLPRAGAPEETAQDVIFDS